MALVELRFLAPDPDTAIHHAGRVVVLAESELPLAARPLDRRARGALSRALASDRWSALAAGEGIELAFPAGIEASGVMLVKLARAAGPADLRKAGATIARGLKPEGALVLAQGVRRLPLLVEGIALRAYDFAMRAEAPKAPGPVALMVADPEARTKDCAEVLHLAEAVHFARDLINEPANVLTTGTFADRLLALRALGLDVEVLDEAQLAELGMRALLGVGQGSDSPSKVVVMQWKGADTPPLALIGKGVVFDSGGLSIKPAGGMEEMITDMGGAGVVAGTMMALAARKAAAHVVGLVGLVENMPDGRAQRPGDVVRSMKGDTIEIINTDAEGRLVLADVLWYAQERFQPTAMIDLATLTGACVVALGHENAAVFANDDALAGAVLKAAEGQGEGAWRMPLGPAYDQLIKSRMADMKNTGGRWGGAITAAQFLQRFVKPGTPWVHLDIAGVTLPPGETTLAPKGATGWGVRTLDALVRARFETGTSA
ncbi:MAG: leucyl aminopeptidase [Rhodobacter sp.]|uniref:leucyl aminopeptidase n=1 Tax=Pararhodobacter sp. TaxID=2127056 RepID=UPI001DB33AAC|nr:leucyl aminopeptidase [Pararhodobacter sp.]MCB1344335.1 leucyl aminopeptidase [Paracoccaceae bacterium]MCC0074153.1 leucyl aminopeptidase [Rhodobacter sp.]HPD92949.1 leucyl aminopeptidase [Pararhodobacter sp.]